MKFRASYELIAKGLEINFFFYSPFQVDLTNKRVTANSSNSEEKNQLYLHEIIPGGQNVESGIDSFI